MENESMKKAIQKFRAKRMGGVADFMDPDTADMAMQEGEVGDDAAEKETSLAPSLKDQPNKELEIEMSQGDDGPEVSMEEKSRMSPQDAEMAMQDMGFDDGDAVDPEQTLKGMYQPGDENKKGFMGKAAMLMKNKLASRGR